MKPVEEFMTEAIRMAIENVRSGNGGPFGALVVKDGGIIGRGVNLVTSSNDPTSHAEINAIRDACKNIGSFQISGCDIYTTCEPCPMCLGAIYWARPKHVFYAAVKSDATDAGFDDSFIYEELQKDFPIRRIPFSQLMRKEALEIFAEWKNNASRLEY
jgi:guanine deaminase